jgi:8-oxo-dGTP pyrophosphatase MutT (NUDIX family)
VVPAAYVLLLRAGATGTEVLLQLRSGTGFRDGYWAAAAAGHVERGEAAPQAACREAAEELGVTVDETDLVPLITLHRTENTGEPVDERVDFFYTCGRWRGEPSLQEPERAADLRWFALDALPDPVVPHEHRVLESLRAGSTPAIASHGFPAARDNLIG